MSRIRLLAPRPFPVIAQSATFLQSDTDKYTAFMNWMMPTILHGSLAQRGTKLLCVISRMPATSLKSSAELNLKEDQVSQQLWYTHPRTNAEGSLLYLADSLLKKNQKKGRPITCAHSFTGGDGLMMKSSLIEEITNYAKNVNSTRGVRQFTRMQMITGKSAINAGIGSDNITHANHKGFLQDLYEFLQEAGRVDRRLTAIPGSNTYEVHLLFGYLISLYIQILSTPDANARRTKLFAMYKVVRILLTPSEYYHSYLETYFEYQVENSKQPYTRKGIKALYNQYCLLLLLYFCLLCLLHLLCLLCWICLLLLLR